MKTKPTSIKPRWRGARQTSSENEDIVIHEGTFHSFDGTKLFYRTEGEGGIPLVFCYGLMCSSLHWTYQIDHFRKNNLTLTLDHRAHQNSDIPKDLESLKVESFATDLGLFLDHLKIKEAVFLGHSMGVNIVLEYYKQQPERFKGMILSNGTARRPLETLMYGNINQKFLSLIKSSYQYAPGLINKIWKFQKENKLTRFFITLGGFNPFLSSQEDIARYINEAAEAPPEVFLKLLENYDLIDSTPWLHQINTPTLIIAGEKDHITPVANQKLLHQLIPNSKLEIVRGGSHCVPLDMPDHINRIIERFLGTLK